MKKILLLFFIGISILGYTQNIEANYKIEVCPTQMLQDTGFEAFVYFAKINATYSFSNYYDSTINFNAILYVAQLGISNLKIKLYDSLKKEISNINYSYTFKEGELTINLRNKISNFYLNCNYQYIGSSGITIPDSNYRNIIILGGNNMFEFFTEMFFSDYKIKIINNEFDIIAPKSVYLLSSLNILKKNNELSNYYYKFKNVETPAFDNMSFSQNNVIVLLDTVAYNKQTIISGNNQLNFFIRKNNKDSLKTYLDKITSIIKKIETNINCKITSKTIDIVEFDWTTKKYAMGKCYNNLLLVDKSFIGEKNYQAFIHEYLHTQLSINYKSASKGFFFINETLIEYLSNYFSYFSNKKKYYNEIEKKRKSILINKNDSLSPIALYDIEINNSTAWNLIYEIGTVYIYDFANKVGEENFVNIALSFFKEFQDKGTVEYSDFINYLIANKINRKAVLKLDKKIKKPQ